jgi:hypothetical protein
MRSSGRSRAAVGRRLLAGVAVGAAAGAVTLAPVASAETPAPAAPAITAEADAAAAAARATVRRYAPFIYLAPGERFGPLSARRFIRQSSLSWAHDAPCTTDHEVAARRTVDGTRLGSGGYQHQIADALCNDHGDQHRSNELTRPRQGDKGDVPEDEGFFLNFPNRLRERTSTAVPVYYEYVRHSFVTYWFFYAFNDAPEATNAFDHEGDWERISVRLDDRDRAVTVAYYAHTGYCTRPWSEAGRHLGHPLAYSARGTHATYAWAGSYPIAGGLATDTTGRGAGWATYNRLRNARTQGWYGYGGAWGEVGEGSDSTGPLGPSAFKDPAPTDWSRPCSPPS